MYGAIKKILLVNDVDSGKPRGYAFIEYEHERDMHCKYRLKVPARQSVIRRKSKITKVLGNVKFQLVPRAFVTLMSSKFYHKESW
jgi:hypothetical protein